MRKFLVFGLSALVAPAIVVACSSGSSGDNVVYVYADSGNQKSPGADGSDNNQNNDDASLKPSPQSIDAGIVDASPPTTRPDASRPTGAGDAGPLDASSLQKEDAAPPATGDGDPLDPVDESLMPDYGFDEGQCTDYDLTDSTGRCYNDPVSGADYVEGCVNPDTYLLDCARYDSAGETRSICQDDGTTVGCVLIDQAQVASFEASQTDNFIDQEHACPTSWEGYGYCTDTYISICHNGEDYWLDCSIYNSAGFTYSCGTDSDGNIDCQ